MAPLPENSTDRVWLDYTDGHNPHSLLVRHTGGQTNVGSVLAQINLFFGALAPQMYLITVTGARYSDQGSVFSFPVAWEGPASYGTGAMPGSLAPRQLCYLARDTTGRRVRWFVFGCKLETPNDYRFNLTENADLAEAWNVISLAQQNNIFCTIAGVNPTLYSYIDVNFNSYYEAKTRA